MQRLFPFLAIGLFLAVPSLESQKVIQSADEAEHRGIETETAKLEQQNDSALAKFFAKDWICVGPTRVLSKTEFVENIKHNFVTQENGVNPTPLEKKNVPVRVLETQPS